MSIKSSVKKAIVDLDKLSPFPILYPFVMTGKEVEIFDSAIKSSHHYIEFGLGGSTIRAIQKSKATIYTVESSFDWINYMRQYSVIRYSEGKRLHIFPVDIGPTREWGFPVSDSFIDSYYTYSSSIFKQLESKLIDLVLVDGRFRVACVLKAIIECHNNSNVKILIHDFWGRPHYHVVLKYLDTVERIDRIGLFSIKTDIDFKSLISEYNNYKNNPE